MAFEPLEPIDLHPGDPGVGIDTAFDHLASLPDVTPPPHPDLQMLEAALSGGLTID